MYKCCITGKTVPPHTPAHKVILEIRPVKYKHLFAGNSGKGETRIVSESRGWEVVREGFVSPKALSQVPKLEELLETLDQRKLVERTYYLKKRPKKKYFRRKQTKVYRLKIVRQDGEPGQTGTA